MAAAEAIAVDRDLVSRLVAGDELATRVLEPRMQSCVWTACLALTRGREAAARAAFRDVWPALSRDRFRRCAAWDGREPLTAFLTLAVRDLVMQRIVRLIGSDRDAGWEAFGAVFEHDIRRQIARRHAAGGDRDDAYQDVMLVLWEGGCRRLRAYSGRGSFAGHVRKVVANVLISEIRRSIGRRRPPAAVQALSALDQAVFAAVHWADVPDETARLRSFLASRYPDASSAEIEASRIRVRGVVPPGYVAGRSESISLDAETAESGRLRDSLADTADAQAPRDPFEALAESQDEALLEAAADALDRAKARLDDEDRRYLDAVLGGLEKPRDVGRILRRPATDVYVIKERVNRRLLAILAADPDVAAWRSDLAGSRRPRS